MSVQRLSARTADVGGIPIARLLPNKGKKPIGAWCFLDHAGPTTLEKNDAGMQVGRHPHTNLQTFTWMLEGELLHQDSLGNKQVIRKNQVNLMTAGTGAEQGISHTEQSVFTDENARQLHAIQLWIALPMDQAIKPSFYHYPNLPTWQENDVVFTLTTGSYKDNLGRTHKAPTLQYSPLVGIDLHFLATSQVTLTLNADFDYGILVVAGSLKVDDMIFEQDELARIESNGCDHITLQANAGTRLMFIGAQLLSHPVALWWNFVDKDKAGIEQSIKDWNNYHPRFGDVAVDLERLVAPELPEGFKVPSPY